MSCLFTIPSKKIPNKSHRKKQNLISADEGNLYYKFRFLWGCDYYP